MDLHKPVDLLNRSIDELTPEERMRFEHQQLHEFHKGHESMHMEMGLIFLVVAVVAQVVLIQWKQRQYKSYSLFTLIGLWVIPVIICLRNLWWRFIIFSLIFSIITGIIFRKSTQTPIQGTTPRLVYKWFFFIYRLSYLLGIIGYVIMMAAFFGLHHVFNAKQMEWMDGGIIFVFYGLYYGVLGRDVAEICSEKLASKIGYYTNTGMPTRHLDAGVCAVCGNKLLVSEKEEGIIENTYMLPCSHGFHEFCIRGWCIIGKKQTCPYCNEKVDLKRLFQNPWERPHLLYGSFLDWMRWLLAWQPLIFFIVQCINWSLGLK